MSPSTQAWSSPSRRRRSRSLALFIAAVVSGASWGLVPYLLGQAVVEPYNRVGLAAAILTGVTVAYASRPLYGKSDEALLWMAPLTVYLSIPIFSFFLFALHQIFLGPIISGYTIGSDQAVTVHHAG
jgi:hypothetical protein